ncbi:MAG TPA: ATP-binding protein [Caulobacteraceae bacterium]|nr:ATP-binding protein [Caulobacteraceae bacterium]
MADTAAQLSDGADEIDPEPLRESFNRIVRVAVDLLGGVGGEVAIRRRHGMWRSSGRDTQYAPLAPHVEAAADALWLPDWREDPRAGADLARVPDDVKPLRFYAGAPIRLADGRMLGVLSVMGDEIKPRDETKVARLLDLAGLIADEVERRMALLARADAEAEAAAARATLAALVENAPFAVSMTDHDVRLLQVSRRWREERGLVGADVIGRSLYEIFPAADWSKEHDRILAGETLHREVQLTLPDGRRPWVRYEHTPWRDASGRIGGILSMSVDVTELVETLQRAEASEKRLMLAMEIGDLAMWEMDLRREEMTFAGINPVPSKGVTVRYADLTAEGGVWEAVHPEDRPGLVAAWQQHCQTCEPFRGEVRLMRSDAPHVWVQLAAEALRDEKGEIVRVVNVMRNVDEIKRAQINLRRARDAAEAANRAKSEFLANMSHEIRTPLNGVMGVASALSRTELSGGQREMVGLITSSAETLEALLSDVLDLARIESGRLELKAEPFDLAQAARDVASLFEPSAKAKGLALSVESAPAAAGLFVGDAARLRQVISNLVSNAVKFTETGSVRVGVQAEASADGTALKVTVADTGIGFTAEAAERLFERFEQADGSITRRYGGTGLGLAISRSLVDAMGGHLSATGEPGHGAVFTIELTLPRADAPAAGAAEAAELADADLSQMRVLLAEDHPTNRRVIELILGAAGVDLTCVENGAEALDAWREGDFDLVLMDMQMPVMDGLTATRGIRDEERRRGLPRTPIHALTANAMAEHAKASAEAGVDGHLTKPISAEALLRAVAEAAARAKAGAARLRA